MKDVHYDVQIFELGINNSEAYKPLDAEQLFQRSIQAI
jgi:hypothetical protein